MRALDLSTTTFVNLWCVASISGRHFLLLCVCRPGSEAVSTVFLNEITAVLEQLSLLRYRVVLCGDFNIHMDDPDDSVANRFHQLLESFDCIQHVAKPIHTAGHILDLVIARSGSMVWDTVVGEMVYDHR
jgi:hypothetical protein